MSKTVTAQNNCHISFRQAGSDDFEAIARVIRLVAIEDLLAGSDPSLSREDELQHMLNNMDQYKSQWFLALQGKTIIGAAGVAQVPPSMCDYPLATFGLCVLKEFRQQGIGSTLLQEILNWCLVNNLSKVALSVFDHNQPALNLYRSFGFLETKKRKTTLLYSGRFLHEILMEKSM